LTALVLPDIARAVEQLLHERGGISAREVDVRFEAPTTEWVDSLTRPTINFFLYDVRENAELRRMDMQMTQDNGRARLTLPPRRINLRYMISAVTTDLDDEYRLLWRALATLMRFPHFPAEVLPEALREVEPPIVTRLAEPDDGFRPLEMWNALGSPPRPTLLYLVTAPLDLEHVFEAPLVLTRTIRSGTVAPDAAPALRHLVGGVVRGRDGRPVAGVNVTLDGRAIPGSVTDKDGRYALRGVSTGSVVVRVAPAPTDAGAVAEDTTVSIEVPGASYDITLP
jgi:hypothetical protein